MKLKNLEAKLKRIDNIKEQISALRDQLREEYEDLGGVVDSLDRGCQDIEEGLFCMQSGLDSLSERL